MHGRVRALLLQDLGRRPSLTAVAGRLQISERTLCRRLALQGVSFRSLLDELRAQLAVRYLRETSIGLRFLERPGLSADRLEKD
jgi:AraC-like DNA-binding protein